MWRRLLGWQIFLFPLGPVTLIACSTPPESAAPSSRVVGPATALPESAAPKSRVVDPASLDMSDVISYRTLSRADFKGKRPPPDFAPYADRIGAATCAHIVTTPDTQVMVQPVAAPGREVVYRATPHHLQFFAQMERNCSWWNPHDLGIPKDYILEHEQIHFAIFELEARRLNASVPEIEAHLNATAASPEAVLEIARQHLEEEIQGRMKDIMARSRQFDEDTSMGHKPEQQKRWWELVRSELAATSP
jgi:hypothetical protein